MQELIEYNYSLFKSYLYSSYEVVEKLTEKMNELLPKERQAIIDAHIAGQKFASDNNNHDSEEYFTQKYNQ